MQYIIQNTKNTNWRENKMIEFLREEITKFVAVGKQISYEEADELVHECEEKIFYFEQETDYSTTEDILWDYLGLGYEYMYIFMDYTKDEQEEFKKKLYNCNSPRIRKILDNLPEEIR